MTLRKRLRPCRGGGSRDEGRGRLVLCVALVLFPSRLVPPPMGDASVPTPHPHHSRPYDCDNLPPKNLPGKGPRGSPKRHQPDEMELDAP
jgi:hypothetical protein